MNAVIAVLNPFAATGHIHYYHTVRRSERLWAGLWTDIVIKSVPIRTHKSRGGLIIIIIQLYFGPQPIDRIHTVEYVHISVIYNMHSYTIEMIYNNQLCTCHSR